MSDTYTWVTVLTSVGPSPTGNVIVPAVYRNDPTLKRWYVDLMHVVRALRQAEPGIVHLALAEAAPYLSKAIRNNMAPELVEEVLDLMLLKFRDVPPGFSTPMVIDYLIDNIEEATTEVKRSLNYQLLLGIRTKRLAEIEQNQLLRLDRTILDYMDEVSPEAARMAQEFLPEPGEEIRLTPPPPTIQTKTVAIPLAATAFVGLAVLLLVWRKK